MKLLYCMECGDIVRVYSDWRQCHCRKTKARYTDDRNAVIEGPGRMLGCDTERFYRAVQSARSGCGHIEPWPQGTGFPAFVMPTEWPTVKGPDEMSHREYREALEAITRAGAQPR